MHSTHHRAGRLELSPVAPGPRRRKRRGWRDGWGARASPEGAAWRPRKHDRREVRLQWRKRGRRRNPVREARAGWAARTRSSAVGDRRRRRQQRNRNHQPMAIGGSPVRLKHDGGVASTRGECATPGKISLRNFGRDAGADRRHNGRQPHQNGEPGGTTFRNRRNRNERRDGSGRFGNGNNRDRRQRTGGTGNRRFHRLPADAVILPRRPIAVEVVFPERPLRRQPHPRSRDRSRRQLPAPDPPADTYPQVPQRLRGLGPHGRGGVVLQGGNQCRHDFRMQPHIGPAHSFAAAFRRFSSRSLRSVSTSTEPVRKGFFV